MSSGYLAIRWQSFRLKTSPLTQERVDKFRAAVDRRVAFQESRGISYVNRTLSKVVVLAEERAGTSEHPAAVNLRELAASYHQQTDANTTQMSEKRAVENAELANTYHLNGLLEKAAQHYIEAAKLTHDPAMKAVYFNKANNELIEEIGKVARNPNAVIEVAERAAQEFESLGMHAYAREMRARAENAQEMLPASRRSNGNGNGHGPGSNGHDPNKHFMTSAPG